jgi:antitoxin VapB
LIDYPVAANIQQLPRPPKSASGRAYPLIGELGISIVDRHRFPDRGQTMSETGVAKLFKHGRSQAVRLPLAFRMPGDRVRVRRVASGILLEPIIIDTDAWFATLDRFADIPFMEDGRRQPAMPEPKENFE